MSILGQLLARELACYLIVANSLKFLYTAPCKIPENSVPAIPALIKIAVLFPNSSNLYQLYTNSQEHNVYQCGLLNLPALFQAGRNSKVSICTVRKQRLGLRPTISQGKCSCSPRLVKFKSRHVIRGDVWIFQLFVFRHMSIPF
jgi:hypothetical protein